MNGNPSSKDLIKTPVEATEPWANPVMVELDLNSARGNFCNYTDEGDFKKGTVCTT